MTRSTILIVALCVAVLLALFFLIDKLFVAVIERIRKLTERARFFFGERSFVSNVPGEW